MLSLNFQLFLSSSLPSGALIMVNTAVARLTDHTHCLKVRRPLFNVRITQLYVIVNGSDMWDTGTHSLLKFPHFPWTEQSQPVKYIVIANGT